MMSKITDLRGQLDAARKELHEVFQEAGDDFDLDKVKAIDGDSAAKAEWIKNKNDELTRLSTELEQLDGYAEMKGRVDKLGEVEPHPGHPVHGIKDRKELEQPKTIGEQFTDSIKDGWRKDSPVEIKAVFGTAGGSIAYTGSTTGWFPMDVRIPRVVDAVAVRESLSVLDLIPKSQTNSNAITYMQEEAVTIAAAEVTEGSAKPEASLDLTPVTEPVRKIAVWIPVTEEQLADVPQVRDYLNNRLGYMVRNRLAEQVLVGNGTAPNISGILDRTGLQAAQAKGSDPAPDAIYKEINKIRVNDFSEPNGVVMHPNDWQDIRLLRTADGLYIWGAPMDAGPERIWGLPVALSTMMTEGTALVGDFRQTELAMRQGLELRISDSHDDYFIKNVLVVLAELRAALLVFRPGAFGTVTGL